MRFFSNRFRMLLFLSLSFICSCQQVKGIEKCNKYGNHVFGGLQLSIKDQTYSMHVENGIDSSRIYIESQSCSGLEVEIYRQAMIDQATVFPNGEEPVFVISMGENGVYRYLERPLSSHQGLGPVSIIQVRSGDELCGQKWIQEVFNPAS